MEERPPQNIRTRPVEEALWKESSPCTVVSSDQLSWPVAQGRLLMPSHVLMYLYLFLSLSFFFIFLFFNSKDTCKAVLILRNVPYKEWLSHLVKENEQEKNKLETRNNRDLEWCVSIY